MRICYEEGVPVTSLPGAAACITALTMSVSYTHLDVYKRQGERCLYKYISAGDTACFALKEWAVFYREVLECVLEKLHKAAQSF